MQKGKFCANEKRSANRSNDLCVAIQALVVVRTLSTIGEATPMTLLDYRIAKSAL